MSDAQTIDLLNRLLEAESTSILARLGDAEPFVGWPATADRVRVERVIADSETHRGDLARAILDLRGCPVTPRCPLAFGGVNFLSLSHLMPDVVSGIRGLVRLYEASHTGHGEVDALIARILQDHRRHLVEMERASSDGNA